MVSSPHFRVVVDWEAFAVETGTTFRGLSVSGAPGFWRVVIRFYDRDGTAFYAMSTGEEVSEITQTLYSILTSRGAKDVWRKDKYTSR